MSSISHRYVTRLGVLLCAFCLASFVHFIHNAEFLTEYPGLPKTWTRGGVYGAWLAITAVGLLGWLLLRTRFISVGLVLLLLYAISGLDSLGHYWVAPFSAHSFTMNVTILLEASCALLVFAMVLHLSYLTFTKKLFHHGAQR